MQLISGTDNKQLRQIIVYDDCMVFADLVGRRLMLIGGIRLP